MSIIRLSVMEDGINATDAVGDIVDRPFNRRSGKNGRGAGFMDLYPSGAFAQARDDLIRYLEASLEVEAAQLPDDQPVVVMVHGWNFDPGTKHISKPWKAKANNPHSRLFHFFRDQPLETAMKAHSTSWPLGLGVEPDDGGASGLAIAFGWDSAPGWWDSLTQHGLNPYARAYRMVREIFGWQLAVLLEALSRVLPARKIDIVAHSLGTAVVTRALAKIASGSRRLSAPSQQTIAALGRVILLAGAEYVAEAQFMMRRLNWRHDDGIANAERDAAIFPNIPEFYNVTSRENDVLDKLGENLGPTVNGSRQVIGHNGLEMLDPRWCDIPLDHPEVADWFQKDGREYAVSGDNTSAVFAVLDHWIHFTWPDNMRVYKDILRERDVWNVSWLKSDAPDLFNVTRRLRGHGWA